MLDGTSKLDSEEASAIATDVLDITEPINTPHETPADVGKSARQGGAWSVISYVFTKVTGFASSIVLARLLIPEDFGLIAMVNTVLALVQVVGAMGIGTAVMHQREDIDEFANTGWWMDILCGIVLFAAANAASPLAAMYFHEPRVPMIVLIASFNYLINPIGNMMDVLIRRDLKFKLSTKIALVQGLVASVLTILSAFAGLGVWSFIYPHIVAGVLTAAMRWRNCSFRPHLPIRWDLVRRIWKYGRNILGSTMADYINQNVDYLLVGGLMGGQRLGFYVFAYSLGTWVVSNVTGTLAGVLFPTFASVQGDPARARAMFLKLMRLISLIGFPIVCIEVSLGPLFVGTVYTEKWLPAVAAFRLIAVYGMARAVCSPGLTLISALGRPDVNFKTSAAMTPVLVTAIYIGSHYGIEGVALATALANGTFAWLYVVIPFRILGWRRFDAVEAVAPAFVCAVATAIALYGLRAMFRVPSHSYYGLAALLVVGVTVYMGLCRVLYPRTTAEFLGIVKGVVADAR